MKKNILCLLMLLLLLPGILYADFYQWKDENGNVVITDYPPPAKSAKKITVHESQNVSPDNNQTQAGPGNTNIEPKKSNEVILYTTSWCPYCKKAVDFFRSRNISFTEYDVEKDREAAVRMKELSGSKGVPFAIINGQKISGYAQDAYERALQ